MHWGSIEFLTKTSWTCEVAQLKSATTILIARTHVVEGEEQLLQVVLRSL